MLSSVRQLISRSPEETIEIGRQLARQLAPPVLVLLSGDLGSGKTTLTKGIVSALGAAREEDVTSPTFTLVHVFRAPAPANDSSTANHPAADLNIFHADLYRIEDFHGLETLALEDALAAPSIVIIEWSERFTLRSEWPRICLTLEHFDAESSVDASADSRRITVEGLARPLVLPSAPGNPEQPFRAT